MFSPHLPPPSIRETIKLYSAEKISVGRSTAAVTRLTKREETLFLKQTPLSSDPDPGHSARREGEVMRWLSNKLPVPEVLEIAADDQYEYLLMRGLPGKDCSAVTSRAEANEHMHALREAIQLLHSIDADDCPFDQTLDVKIPAARARVDLNLVDPNDFDEARRGKPVEEVLKELLETAAPPEAPVFCHGDFCLPNILVLSGRCAGFVDLGRAGRADKYQDLALLGRSLSADMNPLYSAADFAHLMESIGEPHINHSKMHYYCLLDEFF